LRIYSGVLRRALMHRRSELAASDSLEHLLGRRLAHQLALEANAMRRQWPAMFSDPTTR